MQLRIAIISDMHAYDTVTGPAAPSHLNIHLKETENLQHPIIALLDLIERENIQVDLLVSAGDMAEKAQESGIRYAWKAIHRVKDALMASHVGAIPGNHDLDSRHLQGESDSHDSTSDQAPVRWRRARYQRINRWVGARRLDSVASRT